MRRRERAQGEKGGGRSTSLQVGYKHPNIDRSGGGSVCWRDDR